MKNILVLTDFSIQANHALSYAYQIASKSKSSLLLLHIAEPETNLAFDQKGEHIPGEDPSQMKQIKKEAQVKMEKIIAEPPYSTLSVSYLVCSGYSNELTLLMENEFDLIVMGQRHGITLGTRGASGERELHLSAFLEKIINSCSCPLLMVKDKPENFKLDSLVLVHSFNGLDSSVIANSVKQLQGLFHSSLHLLSINTPFNREAPEKVKENMKHLADRYRLENYSTTILEAESLERGILDFNQMIQADMFVVSLPTQTGMPSLLSGSLAEEILHLTGIPVLTHF